MKQLAAAIFLLTIIFTSNQTLAQSITITGCQPYNTPPQATPCPAPGSTQTGATISITNTFQIAAALNIGNPQFRSACLLQNNGTHNMFVYFKKAGASAPSLNASIQLIPSQTINCTNIAGQVLQDEIDITGTSGDTYSLIIQ